MSVSLHSLHWVLGHLTGLQELHMGQLVPWNSDLAALVTAHQRRGEEAGGMRGGGSSVVTSHPEGKGRGEM